MNEILAHDEALFLFLNARAVNSAWDPVMIFLSGAWPWLAGLALALLIFVLKRRWDWWRGALFIALTIGLTDAVSAFVLKPTFARLRPCRAIEEANVLLGCAGQFGFPSNHAANAAALAVGLVVLAGWRPWTIAVLGAAGLVAYSRVYVGAHYPLDIAFGFILGTVVALFMDRLLRTRLKLRQGKTSTL